jgi:hypothetical protein
MGMPSSTLEEDSSFLSVSAQAKHLNELGAKEVLLEVVSSSKDHLVL